MDINTLYKGRNYIDEIPGEFRIRLCGGIYWEYCNGICHSCDKIKCYTSNYTILDHFGETYTSDSTTPNSFL